MLPFAGAGDPTMVELPYRGQGVVCRRLSRGCCSHFRFPTMGGAALDPGAILLMRGKGKRSFDLTDQVSKPVVAFASASRIIGLGLVDKRDSRCVASVIQAGIRDGDQLGTRPDVGRGMGVL